MNPKRIIVNLLSVLAIVAATEGCKPRIRVKPKMDNARWLKSKRPAAPRRSTRPPDRSGVRRRTRKPSAVQRFTDFQVDNLIEGLLKEAAGVEDVKDRYRRLSFEKQSAIRRRLATRSRKSSKRYELLRRALR